jgi:hypothetical protein
MGQIAYFWGFSQGGLRYFSACSRADQRLPDIQVRHRLQIKQTFDRPLAIKVGPAKPLVKANKLECRSVQVVAH